MSLSPLIIILKSDVWKQDCCIYVSQLSTEAIAETLGAFWAIASYIESNETQPQFSS